VSSLAVPACRPTVPEADRDVSSGRMLTALPDSRRCTLRRHQSTSTTCRKVRPDLPPPAHPGRLELTACSLHPLTVGYRSPRPSTRLPCAVQEVHSPDRSPHRNRKGHVPQSIGHVSQATALLARSCPRRPKGERLRLTAPTAFLLWTSRLDKTMISDVTKIQADGNEFIRPVCQYPIAHHNS
jgi:hypothetical protein